MTSDIDECSADSSPCDENADCTNSDGSYRCTCKQGFTGNGAVCEGMIQYSFFYRRDWNGQKIAYDSFPSFRFLFHHSDIDECSADSNPCDENADCTNSDGSYTCNCKQGFKGNGTVCEGKLYHSFIYKSDCNGHNTTYAFFLFPFSFYKISVSVLRIPVQVIADLRLCPLAQRNPHPPKKFPLFFSLTSDIDECSADSFRNRP